MGVVKVEIPVEAATAEALADPRRREAVGRLVDLLIHALHPWRGVSILRPAEFLALRVA